MNVHTLDKLGPREGGAAEKQTVGFASSLAGCPTSPVQDHAARSARMTTMSLTTVDREAGPQLRTPAPPNRLQKPTLGGVIAHSLDTATAMAQAAAYFGGVTGAVCGALLGVVGAVLRGPITDAVVVAVFGIIVLALAGAMTGAVLLLPLGAVYGAVVGGAQAWKAQIQPEGADGAVPAREGSGR
jgi:hypothetical protein